MAFSPKQILSLKRLARTVAATVISGLIGFAASPDALNLVGTDKAWILTIVLIPLLHEALHSLIGSGAPTA